ncbi:GAP family protein [Rhodococcus sp. IEGM 1409]|uniref:GAP family protein n=1 Tax=Rhodococcus sp. IEGM 1409 TaxID=3047082 RepID=UPI0024B866C4|nr:GAP family protein [Rhodococcus sp. IEGM 1409]MDI9900815.1 GAP family protein [Rhodococcus sp. IEGM 1409]
MELVLLTTLGGLALLDSTSIGTLVVPVWMLLTPGRPQVRRLLIYLVVITTFYFVVGVTVWATARVGMPVVAPLLDTPAARGAQLILGIALFALSFRFDSEKRRTSGQADRTQAWRERVLDSSRSARSAVLLAIAAGTAELVTMLPYLAAIAMITAAGLSPVMSASILAGYCLIMVAPAVLLLCGRVVAGNRLDKPLRQVDSLMSRYGDSAIGWVFGIAGFYLAGNAAAVLFVNQPA